VAGSGDKSMVQPFAEKINSKMVITVLPLSTDCLMRHNIKESTTPISKAITFIKNNAENFVDINKIAILGQSSGAQM
jgi:hypothetical protein